MRDTPSRLSARPTGTLLCALWAVAHGPAAHAHEFWIEPRDFTPTVAGPLVAELYTGEYLRAEPSPWNPARFERFELVDADGARDITGARGRLPAVRIPLRADGLQVLVAESVPTALRYPSFEKFTEFVTLEGAPEIAAAHLEAGLPTTNLVELYTRHAKALVRAGDGGPSAPVALGLELELVALDDPYGSAVGEGTTLRFELLLDGAPLVDHQVAMFHRTGAAGAQGASTEATRDIARTDADGRVGFSARGAGTHLVSAVLIRRPSARTMLSTGATWESLWASLSFGL